MMIRALYKAKTVDAATKNGVTVANDMGKVVLVLDIDTELSKATIAYPVAEDEAKFMTVSLSTLKIIDKDIVNLYFAATPTLKSMAAKPTVVMPAAEKAGQAKIKLA